MQYEDLRKEICEIGKKIYMNGFVAANDGNISARIDDKYILTTPTGVSKGFMTPDMLVLMDMEGNIIEGKLKPSSEFKMHLKFYKERNDINAVVHAHPPFATAYAVAGIPLDNPILPEVVINIGKIPVAKYSTPSTDEVPQSISQYVDKTDVILLENHGALTAGENLNAAYFKMETLELYAKINTISNIIGDANAIKDNQITKLINIRKNMKVKGKCISY